MSDTIREEIERVDTALGASIDRLCQQAAAKLSEDIRRVVDEASRQRGALVRKSFESTMSETLGLADSKVADLMPTQAGAPGVEATSDRRTAREIVLEVLREATGPVRGLTLSAAVMREGLTQSAAEKVRRRLVAGGIIKSEGGGFVLVDDGREDSG